MNVFICLFLFRSKNGVGFQFLLSSTYKNFRTEISYTVYVSLQITLKKKQFFTMGYSKIPLYMVLDTHRSILFSFDFALFFQFGRINLNLTFPRSSYFTNFIYIYIHRKWLFKSPFPFRTFNKCNDTFRLIVITNTYII